MSTLPLKRKKQRNFCSRLYKKERKNYYNLIDINDNRRFWISDDKNLSKELSNFFNTTVKKIDIKGRQMSSLNEDSDSIDIALNKHVDYPCVSKVILNNIEKEITNLDSSRKGTFKNITPKPLKETADVCSPLLCDI